MWPFGNCKAPCTIVSVKNKKSSECKKEEKMSEIKVYQKVEAFASVGDSVIYLGIKMLVVGYHDFVSIECPNIPSLNVEWMDGLNHIQEASIYLYMFKHCEVIKKEKK